MESQSAPSGAEQQSAVPAPALSTRDAARMLSEARWKRPEDTSGGNAPPEVDPIDIAKVEQAADPQRALREPIIERTFHDSSPPQEAQADGTDAQQPSQEPVEAPRSWTKAEKDRFNALPRETQEYLLKRETERDTALRNRQNELAQYARGLQGQGQVIEAARRHYEAALPALMQQLNDQYAGEFSDIRTMQDVEKMAAEDWPRYAKWDAHVKKQQAIAGQYQAAQQRNVQEFQNRWNQFTTSEDQKFVEHAPEMRDPEKAKGLVSEAKNLLNDYGFSDEDIQRNIIGDAGVSMRDHRFQRVVRDAILYRRAQASIQRAAPSRSAPVQRPGASSARQDAGSLEIKSLQQTALEKPTAKNMARFLAAKRLEASRR